MPYTITAAVDPALPGAVRLAVVGSPPVTGVIVRVDGAREGQPVRNFTGLGSSGLDAVIDCEAPLGRPVQYQLLDAAGRVLATSGAVTCPPLPSGRALLRSVLRPQVAWMECEPQDETGVEWATSTTVHRVVGSDTPVVVGEVRQRRAGTMTFLAKSIEEADRLVGMCRDGTPLLLRQDPCASSQVRDVLFYPLGVDEKRWGRVGWRLVAVEYQASRFVEGLTDEPQSSWTFAALAASAPDFGTLTGRYANFAALALDIRKDGA